LSDEEFTDVMETKFSRNPELFLKKTAFKKKKSNPWLDTNIEVDHTYKINPLNTTAKKKNKAIQMTEVKQKKKSHFTYFS
jgi:ssDNA-binding Zn-finger/Zn-ribbon topoisomerase 1